MIENEYKEENYLEDGTSVDNYEICYPERNLSNGDKLQNDLNGLSNFMGQVNYVTSNLSDTANKVAEMYAECKRVEAQTEQIKAWSQVEIAKTIAKYKSCQEFMYHTFGERDKALTKHYELLDKAIAGDDKDLIIAALKGIGGIVTKSPLEDLEEFAKLYEDTSQTLLDF